jgi:hypothetical protein
VLLLAYKSVLSNNLSSLLNRKQLVSVWLGVVSFAFVGLFPPWLSYVPLKDAIFRMPSKFAFIGEPSLLGLGAEIDIQRLAIEWALVIAITAALVISFAHRRQ